MDNKISCPVIVSRVGWIPVIIARFMSSCGRIANVGVVEMYPTSWNILMALPINAVDT